MSLVSGKVFGVCSNDKQHLSDKGFSMNYLKLHSNITDEISTGMVVFDMNTCTKSADNVIFC